MAGWVHPHNVLAGPAWEVSAGSARWWEHGFAVTAAEADQVRRIAATLGLDFFAVDYLRRPDGGPVFVDVNVYPTIIESEADAPRHGGRGQWHVWDTAERLGQPPYDGVPAWRRFDAAIAGVVATAAGQTAPGPRVASLWNSR